MKRGYCSEDTNPNKGYKSSCECIFLAAFLVGSLGEVGTLAHGFPRLFNISSNKFIAVKYAHDLSNDFWFFCLEEDF